MDKIGLISTNLAEKIADAVTESPYRVAAELISTTCGQSVSAGGVWNLIQQLGERISKEEEAAVSEMEQDQAKGTEITPVLFEEMDGKKNSRLYHKQVLAGMENSDKFHQKREAQISKKYLVDEINQRILNGDGGSWIKDPYEPDTIFQLDRFHIYQEIKRKITDKEAEKIITTHFEKNEMDEMLEFIQVYADSVDTNETSTDALVKVRSQ